VKGREVLCRIPTSKQKDGVLVGDHTEAAAWGRSVAPRLGLVPLLGIKVKLVEIIEITFVSAFSGSFDRISTKHVHHGTGRSVAGEHDGAMRAARRGHLACVCVGLPCVGMRMDAVRVVRAATEAGRLAGVRTDEGPGVGLEIQLVPFR